MFFLARAVPQMTVNWSAIGMSVVALTLFVVGVDRCGRWFCREGRYGNFGETRNWRLRWTAYIAASIVVLFAAGIGLVGISHQVGWLVTSNQSFVRGSGDFEAAQRSSTRNRLKQIGLAAHNFHDENGTFPAGGTFDSVGVGLHSWQAMLLPFIDQQQLHSQIDFDRNSSANAAPFGTVLEIYLNARIERKMRPESPLSVGGFALSHYAANGRVMSGKAPIRIRDITDGSSETILAGEVNAKFKPWGDPTNWRDLSLGINKSSDGFGSPFTTGAHMLHCDGSVRFLSNETDLGVLKAISTPAGGETIKE
jgi:hypothetical protein